MSFRKLLLSSLFFIAFWAMAFAQNVTVHGLVTNDDDVPQADIVILASAYFSDSTVIMISMTTDGDGLYNGSIDSPGPNIPGWLEVSMVDCWGTTITQNFQINTGSEDFTADFLYCEDFIMDSCLVIILEEWNPGNILELVAWNPLGQEAQYVWNTGDTTESIFPQESGTYCVTATFPWGCVWTDCIDVFVDSNDVCFVYITSTQENDSIWTLEAFHSGTGPIEYVWNTGDQTPSIVVGPGTYCVSAWDSEGCGDTTCVIIDDFSFCEVYIWENPSGGLVAEGLGEPPSQYLWSTGDSTQTIFPTEDGLYCVTATDVNGCSAESCYQYYSGLDSCYVYINPVIQDSSILVLEAIGFAGGEPWLYEWSTGETTQSIIPSGNEESYCVTLTDSDGCVATACFDYSDYCYSWVSVEYVDTNIAILSVIIDPIFQYPGGPSVSYLWPTGDTDPILTVTESGEYCVTVSIGSNICVTESCAYVDFDSIGMSCSVWVYTYPDSMGNWVAEAATWGLGDFEYEWTNGDTTPAIELEFPGQFACVTVTSSFGCEAVACVDSIMQICGGYIDVSYQNDVAFLNANVWSLEDDIELLWSTGETGYSIQTQEEGTYCVTIITANCIYTTCAEVDFNNIDSCGVWISYEFDPLGIDYTANPWGTPPFTYLWSNGDTTSSVLIDLGDPDLCVTITDANGCMSSACTVPIDSCDIFIYFSNQPVPSLHIGSSEEVVSVIWSTGDSTEWLEITDPGTYCADVTTVFGCFSTVCYTIDSIPAGLQHTIEGFVFLDSLSPAEGWVTIYAFNPNSGNAFTVVDSAAIGPDGHYTSGELPDGVYMAKAILTPGTGVAKEFLPTYQLTSTTWQNAVPIGLPGLAFKHDIHMIPTIDGLNGAGVIAGFVTDGNGILTNEEEEVRGNLEGIQNVEIIISDAQGQPLDYTWTVEDGAYRFENLPWGTYRISYDIAGLNSPDIWVTLTPENPTRLQVNIIIEGGSVAVEDLTVEELRIYPNPAKAEVHIPVRSTKTSFEMQLVDMQGKIIKASSVVNDNGVINIDVRAYAPGLYHINLTSDQEIYYGRFIKQD